VDTPNDPGLSTARNLYQFLILAYPSKHRHAYGSWMVQLFCDQYRAARSTGQPGDLASFWLRILSDLVASSLREQMAELRRSMMGEMGSDSTDPKSRRERIANLVLLGLALVILVIGSAYIFPLFLGFRKGLGVVMILAILFITGGRLFKSRFVTTVKRREPRVWIFAGLLLLAVLLVPPSIQVGTQEMIPVPISAGIFMAVTLAVIFIPCVALVLGALLLHLGACLIRGRPGTGESGDAQAQRRLAVALFSLNGLLIGKIIYNLYWLAIWDSTGDSLDHIWLITPVFFAIFAGVLLAALLPWKVKMVGLGYALLIPSLMVWVFSSAKQVDFRQLTEARAGQVSQALALYHAREGRYPQTLGVLVPRYLFPIPGPVIMVGQNNWCYQAGVDYFRLGYLDRSHWSSPIYFGRVVSGQGRSPLKEDVCLAQIDDYRARNQDWDKILQSYGQPTPTPDVREIMP
jgi:hypothetical protein